MLRWLGNALASSIGKKTVMALTGLLLVGFLISHLTGNLQLLGDGESFDAYVEYLESLGPLLYAAEIGLLALFLCHIFLAFRLTLENREARKQRYVVRGNRGAQTPGSASMFITGAILLGFLIKHLWDFRLQKEVFSEAPAQVVRETLAQPLNAFIYLLGAAMVVLHLSHGVQSALQSLGLNHPKYTPLVKIAGWGLALGLGAGFALISVYLLLNA